MNSVESSIVFILTHFYVFIEGGMTLTWNQILNGPVGVFLQNPHITPCLLFHTFRGLLTEKMGIGAFVPGNEEYPPAFRLGLRYEIGPPKALVTPVKSGWTELRQHSSGEKVLFHRHPFGEGNLGYYHTGILLKPVATKNSLQVLHLTSKSQLSVTKCTIRIDNIGDHVGQFHCDNSSLEGGRIDLDLLFYRASRLANLSVQYSLGTLNCDVVATFLLTGKTQWVSRAPKNVDTLKWLPITHFPIGAVTLPMLHEVEMCKVKSEYRGLSNLIRNTLIICVICTLMVILLIYDPVY